MCRSDSYNVHFYLATFQLIKLGLSYKYVLLNIIDHLMNKLTTHNRRSLDLIAARCFFYFSRSYELDNKLDQIRQTLHARLRTATLRNDYEGQAVLINCLLRNYIHHNLYDQVLIHFIVFRFINLFMF